MYFFILLVGVLITFCLIVYLRNKGDVLWGIRSMNKRMQKGFRFSPFRIWIFPKWQSLLQDYGLWEQYLKSEENRKNEKQDQLSEFNIFESAISFTVLECKEDYRVIYNNNHHAFYTEVVKYFPCPDQS